MFYMHYIIPELGVSLFCCQFGKGARLFLRGSSSRARTSTGEAGRKQRVKSAEYDSTRGAARLLWLLGSVAVIQWLLEITAIQYNLLYWVVVMMIALKQS